MPWCPQCGAEYEEGAQQCAECWSVPADEGPTPQPKPPTRARGWLLAGGAWGQVRLAAACAGEAWRVLRRHPALLLPLAIAVFNAVESGVGDHLVAARTAYGRELHKIARTASRAPATDVPQQSFGWTLAAAAREAGHALGLPVHLPTLSGTTRFLAARWVHMLPAALPVSVLLVLSVLTLAAGAFLSAGYLGVIRDVSTSDTLHWRRLSVHARQYGLAIVAIVMLHYAVRSAPWGLLRWMNLYSWLVYGASAVSVLLSRVPIVLIHDACGLRAAFRGGVQHLWQGLAGMGTALAALILVRVPLRMLFLWLTPRVQGDVVPFDPAAALQRIPGSALERCVYAALGVLTALWLFAYYGALSAAEEEPSPEPAVGDPAPA
jgi:hypothetical protein